MINPSKIWVRDLHQKDFFKISQVIHSLLENTTFAG